MVIASLVSGVACGSRFLACLISVYQRHSEIDRLPFCGIYVFLFCHWMSLSYLLFPPTADFGVSAELATTMSKRKTVIGTPYWMVRCHT
jgi:hypothetical protein